MKDGKQLLEDYEVPQILEEDIMETIHQSKILLKQAPLQKRETHTLKQMQHICFYHFPKIFILQIILTVILFLAIYPCLSKEDAQNMIPLILTIGGILFSMISSVEIMRNHFYDMWETEKTCCIRMENIIGFKLCLLTITTFLSFTMLTILVSLLNTHTDGIQNLTMAILPYLCITTCIVQLKDHIKSIQGILCIYAALAMFFITPMIKLDLYQFISQNNLLLLILCFILCLSLNALKLKKVES